MTISPESPKRPRALLAAVVLASALVSGGWLVERGLAGGHLAGSNRGAQLFDEVYQRIARDYVDTIPDSTLYTRAIDGLVSELRDPHSTYLSPQLLARLSERTSGRYAGVGAQIDVRDGWVTIVAPMPGGPAVDAGILTGDRIIEVDGKPLHDVSIEEAQKALRGTPGSVVRVSIERPGIATPLKFALTRREIKVRSVQHAAIIRDHIGYVALTIFSEESVPDLRRTIDSLRSAGMTSLIFDLRGDPGGLLDQGVGVADLFLDAGQRIVTMRGRTPDASRSYDDRATQPWPNMPITVLVDNNSASAAEIVAGALQDHDRALIVGETTFGKALVQSVYPISEQAGVAVTTGRYYTPSGRLIQRPWDGTFDEYLTYTLRDQTSAERQHKAADLKLTDAGRKVYSGGGIEPDKFIVGAGMEGFNPTRFGRLLFARQEFANFADQFRAEGDTRFSDANKNKKPVARGFVVDDKMVADFKSTVTARKVKIDEESFAKDDTFIRAMIHFEIDRALFTMEEARHNLITKDPQAQFAVAQFPEAEHLIELAAAKSTRGAKGGQ